VNIALAGGWLAVVVMLNATLRRRAAATRAAEL
jgi:hypothetical protein